MRSTLSRHLVELDDDSSFSLPVANESSGDGPVEETIDARFNLVKVFSATKARDREKLGDRVTAWAAANSTVRIVRTSVTQSSDAGFHCLTFVLFCADAT